VVRVDQIEILDQHWKNTAFLEILMSISAVLRMALRNLPNLRLYVAQHTLNLSNIQQSS